MLHEIVVEPVKDEKRFQRQTHHLTEEYPRWTRAVKKLEQKGRRATWRCCANSPRGSANGRSTDPPQALEAQGVYG